MIDNRMKIERQLDLAREQIHSQLSNSPPSSHSILRRESSFDLHLRVAGQPDLVPTTDSSDAAAAPSTPPRHSSPVSFKPSLEIPTANGNGHGNGANGTPPASAKRRAQILARLGLPSSSSTFPTDGDESDDPSRSGYATPSREQPQTESQLRRRYSMGTLKLADIVKGRRGDTLLGGGESESEGEEVIFEHHDEGGEGGWSSAGSSR